MYICKYKIIRNSMFLQSILLMHIQHCSAFSYTLQTNLDLSFELSNLKHLHCGKWCILTYSVRNAALPSWCPWSCLSAVCCYRVCWLLCVSLSVTCVTQNDFVILPRQWLCVWCVFQLWVKPVALSSPRWLYCQSDMKEAYFSQQSVLHLTETHLWDVCPPLLQAHIL